MGELEEIGPFSRAELAGIAAPALVMVGDQDVALARESAGYLAATMSEARLRVVADADHFVSSAQPAEFAAELTGFLATRYPPAPASAS